MKRLAGWALVALLCAAAASAATATKSPAPAPAAAAPSGMAALGRNIALGQDLADRPGSEAEYAQVQELSEEGMRAAREAVQKSPKSAEAQYLLGSWLLYGYRVIKADRITYDAQGLEHQDKVSRVVLGNHDDPSEGLEALRQAYQLSPTRGQYLLDYGAALYDYERPQLAEAVLKKVWMGDAHVTAPQKLRAALIMSDIESDRGDIASARGWLYRALSDSPEYSDVARRLRQLDTLQAEQEAAPPVAVREPETAEPEQEEVAPEDQEGTGDESVAPDQTEGEQPSADESEPAAGGDESGATEEQPEAGQSEEAPAEPEAGE